MKLVVSKNTINSAHEPGNAVNTRRQPGSHLDHTVDAREVQYYAELADRWWDPAGPFWPLHRLNALRVRYLRGKLSSMLGKDHASAEPLSGVRLIDIGCGGGILSESMTRLGAEVTGIDVVEKNIHVARHHSWEQGLDIDYRLVAASELSASESTFDVVLNMEVVEHVADLPSFMAHTCSLVRPGGIMVIATINRTWLSYLFAILGAEYILRWLPRGTHRWWQFPKPRELEQLLRANDLRVQEKVGVKINPISKKFSLTPLDFVNYMILARKRATSA